MVLIRVDNGDGFHQGEDLQMLKIKATYDLNLV